MTAKSEKQQSTARYAYFLALADLDRKLASATGAIDAVEGLLRDLPRLPCRMSMLDRRRHP